jgi:hypothetical protein
MHLYSPWTSVNLGKQISSANNERQIRVIEEACRVLHFLDAMEKRCDFAEGHFCIREIEGNTTPCLGKKASGVIELMIATAGAIPLGCNRRNG